MFVKDFMTRNLVTAQEDEKAGAVLQRMREEGLRRLPVLGSQGELTGIITDRRLLEVLTVPVRRGEFRRQVEIPPALIVGQIMNRNLLTISPEAPLEEAALLMAENRVGSLVVVEDNRAVGIITETDLFRVFLRLLIGEEPGLRVTFRAPAFRGILADITTELARAGGNLLSLGNLTQEENLLISFKVADLSRQEVEDILSELPVEDAHIHEMPPRPGVLAR